MCRLLLLLLLFSAHATCLCATQCPATHFEPSLEYGAAFGGVTLATSHADLGKIGATEELVFEYFEYGTRDGEFGSVYGVHIMRDSATGNGRLLLTRRKNKSTPHLEQAAISVNTVDKVLAIAGPIVQNTHYRDTQCAALFTDGFIVQIASGSPTDPSDLRGGEAYSPNEGSPADRIVKLGRYLRNIIVKHLPEGHLAEAIEGNDDSGPTSPRMTAWEQGEAAGAAYGEMFGVIEGTIYGYAIHADQGKFCLMGSAEEQVKTIAKVLSRAIENDRQTMSDVPTEKEAISFLRKYFPCKPDTKNGS